MASARPYLEIERNNDVAIVRFRITNFDSGNVDAIGEALLNLVSVDNARKIVINLNGINYMVSYAMGKLVTLHNRLKAEDGQLRLCHVHPPVLDKITATRLSEVFSIYDDEAAALASI